MADEALNNVCGTSLYLSANDDSQTEVKLYCQNEDDSKKDTLTTIENDGQYSVDVVGDKMLIALTMRLKNHKAYIWLIWTETI